MKMVNVKVAKGILTLERKKHLQFLGSIITSDSCYVKGILKISTSYLISSQSSFSLS